MNTTLSSSRRVAITRDRTDWLSTSLKVAKDSIQLIMQQQGFSGCQYLAQVGIKSAQFESPNPIFIVFAEGGESWIEEA